MSEHRQRVLNPRAVIVTCCVTAILMFGVRRLHHYQIDATGQLLRNSAMQAMASEQFTEAISLLSHYLTMKPSDTAAREQLSRLLADHVGTSDAVERAFRINEDLLRDKSAQSELRLQQARLAVRLQRSSDAEAHLQILRKVQPQSSEVWYLSGQVSRTMHRQQQAADYFRKAIECPDPLPEAYDGLIRLRYTGSADSHSAESLLNQMIEQNPSLNSLLLRSAWLIEQQRYADAARDLWRAIELRPSDLQANSLLVHCFQAERFRPDRSTAGLSIVDEMPRVIGHFQKLLADNPQQPLFVSHLAAMQWMIDRRQEAIGTLRAGLRSHTDSGFLQFLLIEYLLNDNQAAAARRELEQLPKTMLIPAFRHYLTGRLLMADQKWPAATRQLERSMAFVSHDSELRTRTQLALAMARRQCGHAASAVDTFRAVVNNDPECIHGRLGLAAAWLDAEQFDLAIAEYQRILDVPGVAEWLISLIIERNLQQPASLRNWKLAEYLLQQSGRIPDPAQRALLQTDLLLAQGRITAALDLLEQSTLTWPDRIELSRAQRRLNGELNQSIRERLIRMISQQPDSVAAQAALLRTHLHSRDTNAAETWLNRVVSGQVCSSLSETDRLRLVVHALQHTTDLERNAGREQFVEWLQSRTLSNLQKLIELSPADLPILAQELALQHRASEAFRQIESASAGTSANILARSLREIARFRSSRHSQTADEPLNHSAFIAADAIRQLIVQQPADPELRWLYAETLLSAEQYDVALETLRQVTIMNVEDTTVSRSSLQSFRTASGVTTMHSAGTLAGARMSWILAVTTQNSSAATDLMSDVTGTQTEDPMVLLCIARVALAAGDYAESLRLLESAAGSSAAMLYQAVCHLRLRQPERSQQLLRQLRQRKLRDPLLPIDERLFQSLCAELEEPLANESTAVQQTGRSDFNY